MPPNETSIEKGEDNERQGGAHRLRLLKVAAIVALVIVVVLGAVGLAAVRSMPGGLLYSVKTNVLERTAVRFSGNSEEKARYTLTLLERRLAESKELYSAAEVSSEAVAALEKAVTTEGADFLVYVEEARAADDLASKDALTLLNRGAGILLALERLVESNPRFTSIAESIEDVERDAKNAFNDFGEASAESEGPRVLTEFLTEALTSAQQEIGGGAMSRDARNEIEDRLDAANAALARGNLLRAFTVAGDMARIVMVEKELSGITFPEKPRPTRATSTPDGVGTTTPSATSSVQSGTSTL